MSQVDLVTQRQDLERARDEVLASTTDRSWHSFITAAQLARWVIFGYADSGMSNTLEVEEEDEVSYSPLSHQCSWPGREGWRSCSQSSTVAGSSTGSWLSTRRKDGRWE